MSIELMLNAVSLNFIAFARYLPQTMLQGQVFAIFIITIAAAEAAVGWRLSWVVSQFQDGQRGRD